MPCRRGEGVRGGAAAGEAPPRGGLHQGDRGGQHDGERGERVASARREFFPAGPVVAAAGQRVPQLARDIPAPAVLRRAQHRQQQLVRPLPGPSRRLRRRRARARDLDQGPNQVDTGGQGVDRLDQPRVDVDELGARPAQDHVGRQRAVPAQRRAQRGEVLACLRQVQAELVAGPAARPLADPLAGVERDQLTVREHRLDHDQRPVGRLLHQDTPRPEYSVALAVCREPPQPGSRLHPAHPGRRGADRRLHEGRERPGRLEFRPARGDHSRRLRQASLGQRPERGYLVLHPGQRPEVRHRGQQARGLDPVALQRHDGDLLLHRQQHLRVPPYRDVDGRLQPAERVGADAGHPVHPADMPGHTAQAQPLRTERLNLVTGPGSHGGALPGGQARTVAEQDEHGHLQISIYCKHTLYTLTGK